MTEMIPDDVRAAAKMAADGWEANLRGHYRPGAPDQRYYLERWVETAILTERERCAVIAEMHDHQGVIAAAIRKAAS